MKQWIFFVRFTILGCLCITWDVVMSRGETEILLDTTGSGRTAM